MVNDAAIVVRRHLLDLATEDFRRPMHVDVAACFTVAQAAAKVMVPAGADIDGQVITVDGGSLAVTRQPQPACGS